MSRPTQQQNPAATPPAPFVFDTVPEAIDAINRGEFVVVMDDENRENEGDLVCAASKVTTEGMAWMIKWTSGFICCSLPPSRLAALQLPPLLPPSGVSQDPKGTAYHLTVDSAPGKNPVTTGISAHDRAYTARILANEESVEGDLTRPGHMVTLRYTVGGVRARRGHTECAVDLCYLAGLPPAGLLCELVHPTDEAGEMARRDDCWRFAKEWGLKIISVEGLAEYVEREGKDLVPEALARA
ncbi:3,4-dihydroxy-2-butanone-4-phosphate synthase [Cryptococcus amylolentus CBS 6039]|uniref:3,4-dihydroxy-2-butanone 4-phosphate synthase n=2 Tax=Cryptococcus amylolentus TaxID=104669 RepID=A0A1E3HPP6_9TREE|nr:3,4-dihydroxy-2-butanone-4-phosphate synthase [Cryptococcus amylolentus CBS 6039]ODN78343.1 3,4-dihydroxy-2-butanone-4-phosphate synthase [Cryptococcus amylolentus CBS 6039]ODO07060.1 3,4-dihydroxy-2-butanone-4-phosphate synthase [Cryptococcus amylolentus CBS 6273]